MQAHALRTFLNSRTLQIQHAGTSFEADDDYAKALEQRGIIKTGDAPVAAATPQPTRTQAMAAAPSTVGRPVAPMTTGSMGGRATSTTGDQPTVVPTTVVPPGAPGKKSGR